MGLIRSIQTRHTLRHKSSNQHGSLHYVLALAFIVIFAIVGVGLLVYGHAAGGTSELESGVVAPGNWCLNDRGSSTASKNPVDSARCNGSASQEWTFSGGTIKNTALPGTHCIEPKNGATSADSPVVMDSCNGHSAQQWTRHNGGYENTNASECLAVPGGNTGIQLSIEPCAAFPDQNWSTKTYAVTNSGDCQNAGGSNEGQRIASQALYEHCLWNGGKNRNGNVISQNTLMNWFTDGSPSEEWCADFVSYVFQQAGYPFTRGTSGWDEKASDEIVDMNGVHEDSAGHTPKLGDVVYLQGGDYPQGHVEIVVGTNPLTFLYGDSATQDPVTYNGEMEEGGTPSDIQYYISPN